MILVAHENAAVRDWLAAALRGLGATTELSGGEDSDRRSLSETADLVVASASMNEPNALQLLAASRAAGKTTPFIIVAGAGENSVLAFVSDARGTALERRVLGRYALRILAARLIACNRMTNPR